MSKVLIAFLGTGRKDRNEQSKYAYEAANYQFDNSKSVATPFFADAMMQYYDIQKVLLIGTPGSMWGEVYRYFCVKNGIELDETLWLEISEYCENATKDSPLEIPHQDRIEQAIGNGSKVILLHYGLNKSEQDINAATFLSLEKYINKNDEIYLDITHSFRSLPMYMMNLLLYMKTISDKQVKIANISYGMLEASARNAEGQSITPVVNLTDTEHIMDWIIGAYAFKEYGNSYKIAELLDAESEKEAANRFREFSDEMNLNHLDGLQNQVQNLSAIKNRTFSTIPNAILPNAISTYIKAFKANSDAEFQYKIACWHYEHKNYASSYLSLLEALLTHVVECCEINTGSPLDDSQQAKEMLKGNIAKGACHISNFNECQKAFKNINHIRNTIAHQTNNVWGATNSKKLIRTLKESIDLLKPVFK